MTEDKTKIRSNSNEYSVNSIWKELQSFDLILKETACVQMQESMLIHSFKPIMSISFHLFLIIILI